LCASECRICEEGFTRAGIEVQGSKNSRVQRLKGSRVQRFRSPIAQEFGTGEAQLFQVKNDGISVVKRMGRG
jgi:hypothetical protein